MRMIEKVRYDEAGQITDVKLRWFDPTVSTSQEGHPLEEATVEVVVGAIGAGDRVGLWRPDRSIGPVVEVARDGVGLTDKEPAHKGMRLSDLPRF